LQSVPLSVPPLLRISKLAVTYATPSGSGVPALENIDLEIAAGEIVGILGESGCGKSTLALSLLGLLPRESRVTGEIVFQGGALLSLTERQFREIRGAKISLIHQGPGLALSPVLRVGNQISEVIQAHSNLGRTERRQAVVEILEQVGLPETERIYNAYPHQLSGGELHRVTIAQALACRPELIIADESTGSLDLETQAEILELLAETNRRFGTTILFITHNPALLAGFSERVIVMHHGHIVEQGSLQRVFCKPDHSFTQELLSLVPGTKPLSELSR
jgi:ABC-type glutathione transport system ATPase component